ncbi:MAG TPA: EAL domain-containing protein [Burkholderiaceae bacterium]|nr:EAL domain-containing protein [Burkholderiaceae bacterium]
MSAQQNFTRVLRAVRAGTGLFALLVIGLAWLLLNRGEATALKTASQQVERAVTTAETDVNRSLVGLDMFLADMARWTQHLPHDPLADRDKPNHVQTPASLANRENLNLLLRAALNQNLLLRDVVLLGAQGDVLLSARAATQRLGLEMPDGFLDSVIQQPFPALLVSAPVHHSLSLTSLLYMGRSVRLGDGTVTALVAEVHGPLLSSLLDAGVSDASLLMTLEKSTGQLLASFPPLSSPHTSFLTPSLDTQPLDGSAQLASGRLAPDRVLLAVRPTLYPGLAVSASLPLDNALAEWRKERAAILGVAATILALAAATLLLAQRYLKRLAQAQAEADHAQANLRTSNAELAHSLSLLHATLESTADGILVVDGEGRIRQHNQRFVTYSGIPGAVLQDGNKVHEARDGLLSRVVNTEEVDTTSRLAHEDPLLETRDTVRFADGRAYLRHSTPQLLNGEPVGRVWCYQDITAFEQAQLALQSERAAALQAHAELAATLDALPDLLFEVDELGTYLDYRTGRTSQAVAPPRSILGKTFADVLPPETAAQVMSALRQAHAAGQTFGHEVLIRLPQGSFWFEMSIATKQTPPGQAQRFIVIARDITERKRNESELQLAALVYESSSEGMAVTDAEGNVITVNPAFTDITGYSLADVQGKNLSILNSGRQNAEFYQGMWAALNSTGHWRGELWNRHKNGEVYAEALTINTITSADGSQKRRIALFSDITQRKTQEELIWNQANYDPLTGLPNRRMFREHLDVALAKAQLSGHKLALMFLDLDRFKEVNDTHGHDAGDVLLQTAAQRLRSCVRETDMVARLGGDEFTLILTGMDSTERLDAISHALLSRLAEPFHLGKETEYLSASIGITLAPDDATDSESLIKQADQAMYAAKRLGRNRCERFSLAMQEATLMRSRIARDLRSALTEQQLWLAYQPIVDLRTSALYKAEALVRWQHPIHGLISPATFIPIAEEAGTIHDIGRWVFETAAQQVAIWQRNLHPSFQVSVNKSPAQFRDSSLTTDTWLDVLAQTSLSATSVVLEITEGLLMDASTATREHLRALHDAGVPLSLDDFGTGYSAMSYLHQFELDYLKIDQSFVRNLHPGSKDLALCKATIVMAHELGMKVVAEGIETTEQRDLLIQAGCDFGQGYLFARPLAAADFETLFRSRNGNFLNS